LINAKSQGTISDCMFQWGLLALNVNTDTSIAIKQALIDQCQSSRHDLSLYVSMRTIGSECQYGHKHSFKTSPYWSMPNLKARSQIVCFNEDYWLWMSIRTQAKLSNNLLLINAKAQGTISVCMFQQGLLALNVNMDTSVAIKQALIDQCQISRHDLSLYVSTRIIYWLWMSIRTQA